MHDVLLPGVTTAGVQTAAHSRRPLDAYFTPAGYTQALLHTLPWVREDLRAHDVIEPCVGTGNIVTELTREGIRVLATNDLDVRYHADYHLDATLPSTWTLLGHPDWVVTNPPYNVADTLVPLAYERATRGIAMLLRLSWLEPTRARESFLEAHPPTELIVLPRVSFTNNGRKEMVTSMWAVWRKGRGNLGQTIRVVTRQQLAALETIAQ